MTRVTLGYISSYPYPYPRTPYPCGYGCGVYRGFPRVTHEFVGFHETRGYPTGLEGCGPIIVYCNDLYMYLLVINKIKEPPLAFGAREGVPVVDGGVVVAVGGRDECPRRI